MFDEDDERSEGFLEVIDAAVCALVGLFCVASIAVIVRAILGAWRGEA